MKEEMNSFDIAVVTAELDRMVSGCWVDNIYQLNPKTLLLNLHGKEGARTNLVVEAGRRVHATSYDVKKPPKPSGFCMLLRKYLRNGVVERVQQHQFERIVELIVSCRGERFSLIVEVFGEGNVILVSPQGKILHALSYRRMRDRNVVHGEDFAYPPPVGGDPRALKREDLNALRGRWQLETVKAVARFLGVGGFYAEEILFRSGVPKGKPCASLSDGDLDAVFGSLRELLSYITGLLEPSIFVDDKGGWVDVAPFNLKKYEDLERVHFASFNEALDEFYTKAAAETKERDAVNLVSQETSRLNRILQEQEQTLRESRQNAEAYRKIGDAVFLHLNDLQVLLQRIMAEKRGGKDWGQISETLEKEKGEQRTPAVFFNALSPESLLVQVSVDGESFSLDLKQSAQKCASEFYESSKKARKKAEGAQAAIEKVREQIATSQQLEAESASGVSEMPKVARRREWFEKFRWFRSSDGLLVIGGRDAATNEIVVKKHTEPNDVVFHAEVQWAPFVVVKTQGAPMPEQTIREAAQFAASYSHAWKGGFGSVDVYWVRPEQVSKAPPSGEYLPRGAFMIYGTKNYVKGAILEVAVGLKLEDQNLRVVGGPTEAIATQTKVFVKLAPGREPSGDLAKRIRKRFVEASPADSRKEALRVPLEEIQSFIPAGGGTIK